jgi:hypothetical protein
MDVTTARILTNEAETRDNMHNSVALLESVAFSGTVAQRNAGIAISGDALAKARPVRYDEPDDFDEGYADWHDREGGQF